MIKKYYQSLNSLLYGPFMTPLVFLVFALAFFLSKEGDSRVTLCHDGRYSYLGCHPSDVLYKEI